MDNFFRRWRTSRREIETTSPGRPDNHTESSSGSFSEKIVRPNSARASLTISAIYRAVSLIAKTEAQFEMQYQRVSKEGGNFIQDVYGPGRKMNYLLQVSPNPIMSASVLMQQAVIDKLMLGNAFIFIERDSWGDPERLWLARNGGYNPLNNTYNLIYVTDRGVMSRFEVPARDVIHIPNTFRDKDGYLGISTLQYAFDTMSLIATQKQQSLETAAKGGRVKLILQQEKQGSQGTLSFGLLNQNELKKYAQEVEADVYSHDVASLHGVTGVHNITMSNAEQQLVEQLNMGFDDVCRFFGVPRPLLMLDSNSHYTTPTNATLELMTRTIQPDVLEIEQEFSRKLLTPDDFGKRRFHMCEQPLLRLDKEAQAKVDLLRLQTGSATVNEIRKQYDMPAVEKGDIVYVSTNLAELGSEKLSGTMTPVQEKK